MAIKQQLSQNHNSAYENMPDSAVNEYSFV